MAAGATYEPIATTTLGSPSTQVTFTSIPSTYTDLVLVSNVSLVDGISSLWLRFNSDSGSNYSYTRNYAYSGNFGSDTTSNNTALGVGVITNSADNFGVDICNIQNYSNTTTFKTTISRFSNGNSGDYVGGYAGLWRSTSAINRIDIYFRNVGTDSARTGSTFTLYGIAAA